MRVHRLAVCLGLIPALAMAQEQDPPTRWVFNLGLGFGSASLVKLEAQHRESDEFWSLGLGNLAYNTEIYGSYNWKPTAEPESHYWTFGGGIVHTRLSIFGIVLSANTPEVYGGWGYEWLRPSHRHAVEVHVGYPQMVTLHYLFGL